MYRRPPPPAPQIVRQARDLIEQLNHRTIDADLTAPQINETVQALLSLVQHLPQSIEQLGHALARQEKLGTVLMDDGTDPEAACREAGVLLENAYSDLQRAADSLRQAGNPLWHMSYKAPR